MSISVQSTLAQNSIKTNLLEESLQKKSLEQSNDQELMEVCKSFESYFVEQVYKEMKKSVHSSEDNNAYMQYFGDMMVEQYAKDTTSDQGLGIAQMLFESMKRNQ